MKNIFFVIAIIAIIATVSANKTRPLKVSVYYESHCPDSRDFIITQLHPVFCKVQHYLNLNLVPFGKASSTEDGFICQHGPKECRGNTIHNCVLKHLQDNPKTQVDYANCAMHNPEKPGHIENTCVEEFGVNVNEVDKCYTSEEGYMLMLESEKETKSMTDGPSFVPTIVFDDHYSLTNQAYAFENFEGIICQKLASRGLTSVCSNNVIVDQQTC